MHPESIERRIVDGAEMANVLGCGRGHVDALRKSGRIPFLQLSDSRVRYDVDAVLAALTTPAGARREGGAE